MKTRRRKPYGGTAGALKAAVGITWRGEAPEPRWTPRCVRCGSVAHDGRPCPPLGGTALLLYPDGPFYGSGL